MREPHLPGAGPSPGGARAGIRCRGRQIPGTGGSALRPDAAAAGEGGSGLPTV